MPPDRRHIPRRVLAAHAAPSTALEGQSPIFRSDDRAEDLASCRERRQLALRLGERVDIRATEQRQGIGAAPTAVHDRLNLPQRQTLRLQAANLLDAGERRLVEEPVVRLAASGDLKDPEPVVEAQRLDRHARPSGELADRQAPFGPTN